MSAKLHYLRISWIYLSVYWLAGSRLSLNDPFIKVGSCSIIVIQDRRSFKGYYLISFWSIKILPSAASKILSKQLIRVDFPAPVRPTIPTFSPCLMLRVIPLITSGSPYLYLAQYFSNFMSPCFIAFKLLPSSFVLHFLQY